jgi:uncharacterized membrane protein (DUF106 family)
MEEGKENEKNAGGMKEDKSGKEGSFMPIIIVMLASVLIASFWNSLPFIKNSVGAILDPTAGFLLGWNITLGMTAILIVLSFLLTLAQKYMTDQETLREMKKEQKKLSEESKKFRDNPEKMMEIQKESMKFVMPMMKLSMRAAAFTGIPFLLFLRWFNDYFTAAGNPSFFGFLNWFWFYFIFTIIFSSIFRKVLNVV